jgi:hypothetical protein
MGKKPSLTTHRCHFVFKYGLYRDASTFACSHGAGGGVDRKHPLRQCDRRRWAGKNLIDGIDAVTCFL